MRQGFRVVVICLAAVWAPSRISAVDNDSSSPAELAPSAKTWRIQRVLVPAERPEQWPREEGQKYLPVPAKQFEQRLATLREAAGNSDVPPAVEAIRSEYEAELVDGDLAGRAIWTFSRRDPSKAVAFLAGCQLPISNPQWVESGQHAIVGNDQQGRLAVVVDRSERLQFNWTLRGHQDDEAQRYAFHCGACPLSVLSLTLPGDMAPEVDRGVVASSEQTNDGRRCWRIELGGTSKTELRIEKQNRPQQQPLTLVRNSTTYQFRPQGLEVSTEWVIDVPAEPLRQIVLSLDPPLAAVAVQLDGTDRPFVTTPGSSDDSNTLMVDLNGPLRGAARVLRVTAIAPLVLDAPWKIPLIRLPGSRQLEGAAKLLVFRPLIIGELRTGQCRQTGMGPIADERSGEAIDIQLLSETPDIQIRLAHERDEIEFTSGTSVVLRDNDCLGRCVAVLSAKKGERFEIQAKIARHWIIDDVETEPANMLADWYQEPAGTEPGRLKLQLAAALSPNRELRVIVTGRRHRGAREQPLRIDDLRMLRFAEIAEESRKLLNVRADDTGQLNLTGAEKIEQLHPAGLSAEDASLFNPSLKGLLLVDNQAAESLAVGLGALPAQFDTDIQCEVLARDDRVTESYTMEITPHSDLEQLTVFFSQPRNDAPQWSLAEEETPGVAARRLSAVEQSRLGIAEGEAWQITLSSPRSEPFRLKAQREVPLRGELPVALASIRDAASERGTVSIKSVGQRPPEVTARRLKAITLVPPVYGRYSNTIAEYRYEPADDVLLGVEPPLVLSTARDPLPSALAWIWRARLNSRFSARGMEHVLESEAENAGRGTIEFWLPRGSELRGAWLDNQPVIDAAIVGPSPVRFTLPSGVRFASLVLHWVDETGERGTISSCAAPWLRCDVPILAREWRVWLPPGTAAVDATVDGRPAIGVPWTRRLFGPLARDNSQPHFDMVSAQDWASLLHPVIGGDGSGELAGRLSANLSHAIAATRMDQKAPASTWAALIGQTWSVAHAGATQPPALLIDQQALAEAGIKPDTPIAIGTLGYNATDFAGVGEELECLGHPRAVIITTHEASGRWLRTSAGQEFSDQASRIIPIGKLFDRVSAAAAGSADDQLVILENWTAGRAGLTTPWFEQRPMRLSGSADWTVLRFDCGGSGNTRLWVADKSELAAWACGMFAIALGTRWWFGRRSAAVDVALLLAATGVALLIPVAWAMFSAAVWMGLTAGCVLAGIKWPAAGTKPAADDDASASRKSHWATAAPIGCILIALAFHGFGFAAEGAVHAENSGVHRVLIPVNDQQQQTGGLVYVDHELRSALLQPGATAIDRPPCLMTRLDLRAQLGRDETGQLIGGNWESEIEVEMLAERGSLELPLGADGSTLIPDGVKLDGKPASFHRTDGADKLTLELEGRGRHTLTVLLRPQTRHGGFDFAVPAVASAAVHVATTGNAAPEFDSSLGTVTKTGPDRWNAALGPANRVALHAAGANLPASDASPAVFGVDELYWLRIRPGVTTIDARLRLNVEDGRLQTLRLAADSRLQPVLLRPEVGTLRVRAVDGRLNRWFLELAKPIGAQETVDISWLYSGAPGQGDFSIPRLETSGARAARRFWGVTVDPAFTCIEKRGADTRSIAPEQFSALWLASTDRPELAMQRLRPQSQWELSTRLREAKLSARYDVAWTFDQKSAEVTQVAEVTASGAPIFQYRLAVPESLQVIDVSVRERDAQRMARWSRTSDSEVTVILSAPATGERKLILHGRMPRPDGEKYVLPEIRLQQSESAGYRAWILRRPDVLVAVADDAGLKLGATDEPGAALAEMQRKGNTETESATLVSVLIDAQSHRPCVLRIDSNQPEVNISSVMRVEHVGGRWNATLEAQLDVSKGELNALRFELPESWAGPFEIEPNMDMEFETVPGEHGRLLVLRSSEPVEGRSRLRISGPLQMSVGERPSAPLVQFIGRGSRTQYYLLPRQLNDQQLAWDTRGLVQKPLPSDLTGSVDVKAYRSYQLIGEHYRAVLSSAEPNRAEPRVRLADVCLAWQLDGSAGGVTTFDLEPAGATSCVLDVPASFQLAELQLDGSPAISKRAGENSWEIQLGDNKLPRRLEVAWTGDLKWGGTNELFLVGPTLENIPVDRTLWTISAPELAGPATLASGSPISNLRTELFRFESTVALIDAAASALLDESRDELARWYLPWRDALLARGVCVESARLAESQDELAGEAATEIKRVAQGQARLDERLGTAKAALPTPAPDETPPATRVTDLWRATQSGRSLTYGLASEPGSLAIHCPSIQSGHSWVRVAAAVILLIAAVVVTTLSRRGQIRFTWPQPALYAGLIAIGLVWWLWMTPSALGLAIAGIGGLCAWRQRHRIVEGARAATASSFVKPDSATAGSGSRH